MESVPNHDRAAEVAVVGAGLAGLSAARRLRAADIDVVVIEARDRVGGRTLNHEIGDGKVVELGAQWVGPTQRRVLDLIAELGLETFPTWTAGINLFERDGKVRRYTGTIPKLNPLALAETGLVLARLNRLAAAVPPAAPWRAAKAASWDSQSFDSWIRRNVRTGAARDLLRLAIAGVWATEPRDVSLLHVLFYIASAGSIEALLDAEGGAQQDRVVGGTQLISERIAEELGDALILDSPARSLRHGADGVELSGERVTVRAGRAIVAIPPALAARIAYDPVMPADRDGLTQRMALGSVVKTMSIYERPFWRRQGLSGQATSCDGPISVIFDNSPPDGSPGVLLAFFEGRAARLASGLSQATRRDIVGGCLARMFGAEARQSVDYVDQAWSNEEWRRGCYGGFMAPGAWTDHGVALRRPVGPIHWAGTETAETWSGYMDGAISSGERAAEEIIAAR